MSNVANTSILLVKRKETLEEALELSRRLAAAVLDRPTCGCNKILCWHCRRDKHEAQISNKLIHVLNSLME